MGVTLSAVHDLGVTVQVLRDLESWGKAYRMFSRSALVVSTEPAHFAMVRPMTVFHFLNLLR